MVEFCGEESPGKANKNSNKNPKSIPSKIISEIHGDAMTGWLGMDTEIEIQFQCSDNCKRTKKTKKEVQHLPVPHLKMLNQIRESTWICLNL